MPASPLAALGIGAAAVDLARFVYICTSGDASRLWFQLGWLALVAVLSIYGTRDLRALAGGSGGTAAYLMWAWLFDPAPQCFIASICL